VATCVYCPSPAAKGEDLCQLCLSRWAGENGIDLVRRSLYRENEQLRAECERLRAENKRLREQDASLAERAEDGWCHVVQGVAPEEIWDDADPRVWTS
jgi:hypothetical protein